MSGGGWKEPLYDIVRNDSRNAAWLGNAIGWQGLEDEGKYNTKNPGHAVGKAAQYAATYYLGSLLGNYLGGASGAADTGAVVTAGDADAAAAAEQIAAAQAAQQATQQAAPGLLANTTMESGLTDTGYTPSSLKMALLNANAANGTPLTQNLANYGANQLLRAQQGGLGAVFGSNTGGNKAALALQGLKMMQPQPAPMPHPAPPMQGQQGPLPMMYDNSPYGTPEGNSLGLLTPEERRRKLMMMRGMY